MKASLSKTGKKTSGSSKQSKKVERGFVFLGPPGVGKGTQAALVAQRKSISHVSSGDLFREAVKGGGELGKLAKSYMDKGLLVPDEVTIKMIMQKLESLGDKPDFILDGFPRTLEQAKALDIAMDKKNQSVKSAILIEAPRKELMQRLSGRWICRKCQAPYHLQNNPPKVSGRCDKCGGELYQRDDDKSETVEKRLEIYYSQSQPLFDYYQQRGKLIKVDGNKSLEDVYCAVEAIVKND